MSLTTLLVPAYSQMLTALCGWLEKAAAEIDHAEDLLAARLAPDMLPLSTQIRFTCVQVYEAVYRLRGQPMPEIWQILISEGFGAGDAPGTLAEAHARLAETASFLNSLDPAALDAGTEQAIAIELPNGVIFDMTGEQYVRDWALPQVNFHLVTAYAILRSCGVPLGKADYVPHAFAYLRPGTMPAT